MSDILQGFPSGKNGKKNLILSCHFVTEKIYLLVLTTVHKLFQTSSNLIKSDSKSDLILTKTNLSALI